VRGDIAYSTFYAMRSYIAANRDACRRLVSGLARAQTEFDAAPPSAIAATIASWLPDLDSSSITRIITHYRDAGLWARTPDLPVSTFVRLKASLISGGLLDHDVAYPHVVDAALSRTDPV
jgi:NitT/TauT family transport system substrate-binding protein